MGAVFTGVAGLIYQRRKTRRSAVVASLVGAAAMAAASVPVNFFFSYPVYAAAFGGMDAIIAAYQELNPGMDSLLGCLIAFNLPFTLVKGPGGRRALLFDLQAALAGAARPRGPACLKGGWILGKTAKLSRKKSLT